MEFLEPLRLIAGQMPVFVLVLFRVAGILIFAPVLGAVVIPIQFKVMMAVVLSIVVFPLVGSLDLAGGVVVPNNLLGLSVGVATELLIGMTMGFSLLLMFLSVQVGAELVSQQMALSMGRIVDPLSNMDSVILAQFYTMVATTVYILMNGHVVLVKSLVHTFQTVPLMSARFDQGTLGMLVSILRSAFMLGIRIAGPALAAIFLSTLAMGFISRTMPQLNILAAGFSLRIVLSLILLIVSLGAVFVLFQEHITWVLIDVVPDLYVLDR